MRTQAPYWKSMGAAVEATEGEQFDSLFQESPTHSLAWFSTELKKAGKTMSLTGESTERCASRHDELMLDLCHHRNPSRSSIVRPFQRVRLVQSRDLGSCPRGELFESNSHVVSRCSSNQREIVNANAASRKQRGRLRCRNFASLHA